MHLGLLFAFFSYKCLNPNFCPFFNRGLTYLGYGFKKLSEKLVICPTINIYTINKCISRTVLEFSY